MQADEFLAMVMAFLIVATPFVLYGFLRYLRHRETLFLAERGLVRPLDAPRGNGNGNSSLRWGIILTALGIALSCGMYPIGWMVNAGTPLGFGPWMLLGFIPLAVGLGLVLIYRLTGTSLENTNAADAAVSVPVGASAPLRSPSTEAEIVPSQAMQVPMEGDEGKD
ncbi:MAG TPA: hypothetical protein PK826_03715 [Anaerolineae bacterium]|jgi:hypothetical protein|nr:hypothetical protein [Anaerolineae bacterium]HRA19350.1 hypothetical protein [Anaerolineae bacterium]